MSKIIVILLSSVMLFNISVYANDQVLQDGEELIAKIVQFYHQKDFEQARQIGDKLLKTYDGRLNPDNPYWDEVFALLDLVNEKAGKSPENNSMFIKWKIKHIERMFPGMSRSASDIDLENISKEDAKNMILKMLKDNKVKTGPGYEAKLMKLFQNPKDVKSSNKMALDIFSPIFIPQRKYNNYQIVAKYKPAYIFLEYGYPDESAEIFRDANQYALKTLMFNFMSAPEDERLEIIRLLKPYDIFATLGLSSDIAQTVFKFKSLILESVSKDTSGFQSFQTNPFLSDTPETMSFDIKELETQLYQLEMIPRKNLPKYQRQQIEKQIEDIQYKMRNQGFAKGFLGSMSRILDSNNLSEEKEIYSHIKRTLGPKAESEVRIQVNKSHPKNIQERLYILKKIAEGMLGYDVREHRYENMTLKERAKEITDRAGIHLTKEEEKNLNAFNVTEIMKKKGGKPGLFEAFPGSGNIRHDITPDMIARTLPQDHVLIEFIVYNHFENIKKQTPAYGAIILSSKNSPQWVKLGDATLINSLIAEYRSSIATRSSQNKDDDRFRELLKGLYAKLWEPLEQYIPEGTKTTIISPDATLNFLSFATLVMPNNRFLAERYNSIYVTNGRDLLVDTGKATHGDVAIFSNPDFFTEVIIQNKTKAEKVERNTRDELSNILFDPLPGTAKESHLLTDVFNQHKVSYSLYDGKKSTERQLKNLQPSRIIHIATHGFFLKGGNAEGGDNKRGIGGVKPTTTLVHSDRQSVALENPMHRSGLALAGAQRTIDSWVEGEVPTTDNDGILTALEVSKMDLSRTWLVTLSACETGFGEVLAGEGVMGLRRGFSLAGAQNLLMTLWRVSDKITPDIMRDFYQEIMKTGNISEGLTKIQRDWLQRLRQESGLKFAVVNAGPFVLSVQGRQL